MTAHPPVPSPGDGSASFIQIDSVSFSFDPAHLALRSVKLSIPRGQFVCLLGPSGCGKTTLLNLVAGFLSPSDGYIFVNGQVIDGPGPDRGMVFQDYSLFPWLTIQRNIEFGPSIAGLPARERRERAGHYLDMVHLGHIADRYPNELSGGMKQRVAIARALAAGPKVLLMDEPFAALDEITRQKLNDDVLQLWKTTGITVVFVTHSVFESAYLSSRIVVMKARPGRVHADFPLHTSLERDAHYRTSEEYRQACETVSETLLEAMGGEDAH